MKVLFICVGNINRSQIAEAIFNRLSKANCATSAGLKQTKRGSQLVLEQNNPVVPMRKAGYDLSSAVVKGLSADEVNSAGKVIVILNKARYWSELPTFVQARDDLEFWDIESIDSATPFEEYCRLEDSRIKQIHARVNDLVERIG